MKITQKLLAEVKREEKLQWHDQAWYTFFTQPEVVAVQYACQMASPGDTKAAIVAEAKKYLELRKEGRL